MKETSAYIYEFEAFRLDPERKCLWHDDTLVSLTPKALETLLVLVRNSGEVVGKRELLDEVWPDTFVEESTLSQNILTLRKTLGGLEDGKTFIVTVPRRGFRFVAPVRRIDGSNGFINGTESAHQVAVNGPGLGTNRNGHSKSTAEILPQRLRISPVAVSMAGVLIVAAVAAAAWYLSQPVPMVDAKFREFRTTSLLSDGNIRAAAISPDGKYLSLIEKRGETERLLVRQVGEADPIEIVPPSNRRILGAAFSPDSQYVFYTAYRTSGEGKRIGELFRVPLLGGPAQPVASDVDSPVSVSRSGKLAFVRRLRVDSITQVVVADLDGRNERIVTYRKLDEGFQNAAISPDARFIVSTSNSKVAIDHNTELVLIDVETGGQRRLTNQRWLWIGQAAWLADGSGVAVVGYGAMSPDLTDEIWFVSVPSGEARMLEAGVNGVFGVSVTDDGGSIVAVKSDKITSFAVSPLADLSKEQVIVTKAGDPSLLQLGADWDGDGRLLYSTTDNGNADIWSINADGSDRRRFTGDKYADLQPRISPDGKYLYFLSNRSGQMSVWRGRVDGSDIEKLTEGSDVFSVIPSPDGRYFYYTARADSVFSQHLWRADADGGNAARLTDKTTLQPRISPDGTAVACYYPAADGGPPVFTILNAENGAVVRQFPERKNDFMHEWLKTGRELVVASRDGTGSTLSRLSAETGDAVGIKAWPNETVFRMAVSPDGERLFYEKGISVANVVLLESSLR